MVGFLLKYINFSVSDRKLSKKMRISKEKTLFQRIRGMTQSVHSKTKRMNTRPQCVHTKSHTQKSNGGSVKNHLIKLF
jgi:hypothetical protein